MKTKLGRKMSSYSFFTNYNYYNSSLFANKKTKNPRKLHRIVVKCCLIILPSPGRSWVPISLWLRETLAGKTGPIISSSFSTRFAFTA